MSARTTRTNKANGVTGTHDAIMVPAITKEKQITAESEALEMFGASDVKLAMPVDGSSIVVQIDASQQSMIGTGYSNRLGEVYGKVTGLLNLNVAVKMMKAIKDAAGNITDRVPRKFGKDELPHYRIKIDHTPDAGSDAGKRAVIAVPAVYTYPNGHPHAGKTVQMMFKVVKQVQTVELEPMTEGEKIEWEKTQAIKAQIAANKQ